MVTKNRIKYGLLFCLLIFQAGCMPAKTKVEPMMPIAATVLNSQPPVCDYPLDYNSQQASQLGEVSSVTENAGLPAINNMVACAMLRKAIKLSKPGSNQQENSNALLLLKELKKNNTLSDSDQRFSNLLFQYVAQRQQLVKEIAELENSLKKTRTQNTVLRNRLNTLQSQLNQLKNIEVEIDKKERSVTSPIGE